MKPSENPVRPSSAFERNSVRLIFRIIAATFAISGFAAEEKEILRLDVFPEYLSKPMPIHSIITNVSDKPVTVPSNSSSGGADGWAQGHGNLGVFFTVGFGSIGDFKLVASPLHFKPVTLQPGESTLLPVVESSRERGEKTIEVSFVVDEDYARRNGWWFGSLTKKITIGEGKNPYYVEIPSTPLVPPPKENRSSGRP